MATVQEVPERNGLSRLVGDDEALCMSQVMLERGYVRDSAGHWVADPAAAFPEHRK